MSTSTSVSALFLSGVLPGLLIAALLMGYTYLHCKRKGEEKQRIEENYRRLKERGLARILRESFWALLTPLIILGGIYSGILTPTEAGVISVFYALIICLFVYESIQVSHISGLLDEAMRSFAPLGILIALAAAFGRILTLLQVPQMLANFFTTNFSSSTPFLLIVNLVLLLMGMVMDIGPNITILAPMLLPVVTGLQIDPVHFGVVMIVNLCIGFITLPFGLNLFVAGPMINVSVETVGKRAIPFVGVYILALLLITFIPSISLILISL
jgi:C4-dicarboxylate transporter DctM subunit